nr:hypothetical protein CFP56_13638 [Quercus suber]
MDLFLIMSCQLWMHKNGKPMGQKQLQPATLVLVLAGSSLCSFFGMSYTSVISKDFRNRRYRAITVSQLLLWTRIPTKM